MNILVVEDSIVEATLLMKTLQKIMPGPIDVVHKDTLQKAVDFLKSPDRKIDLVFLDLGLPDSGSWQDTYKAVFQYTDTFPVIVMTSNKSQGMAEELLRHGIEDCIIKGSKRHDSDLLKETIEFSLLRHKVVGKLSREVKEKNQYMRWLTGGYSVQ